MWEVITSKCYGEERCCVGYRGKRSFIDRKGAAFYLDDVGGYHAEPWDFTPLVGRLLAEWANNTGLVPVGEHTLQTPNWDSAGPWDISERICRAGYKIFYPSVDLVITACDKLGFTWGRQVSGKFVVSQPNHADVTADTLAAALCKALDVREGR